MRIWDSVKEIMPKGDTGRPDEVQYLAFSPGGRLLASASVDGTVGIWDPITGTLQRMYNAKGFIIHIEFARKGLRIFTNSNTTCFIKLDGLNGRSVGENRTAQLASNKLQICDGPEPWIKWDSKKILWLPPEFRPICSTSYGGLVALGLASGLVSFLDFRV